MPAQVSESSSERRCSSPRIGVVLGIFPKLSETFVAQELRLLEVHGFSLRIAALIQSGETEVQPIAARIREPIMYMPTSVGGLSAVLLANLCTLVATPRTYLQTMCSAIWSQVRYWRRSLGCFVLAGWLVHRWRLGDGGVQHLHSHFLDRAGQVASYAARISGVTHSLFAHARDIYTVPAGLVSRTVGGANVLVTCTRFNAHYLGKLGIPEHKIRVVYHGVDTRRFSPDPTRGARGPQFRLISAGRLVPKKGYEDMLAAVELMRDAGLSIEYHIYGDGLLRDQLRQICAARSIEDVVHFHGMVVQETLRESLRKDGGIVLCGSRISPDGDRDGIPNIVAEAMAMEVPVVATHASGIPELIEDGISGILVPPGNPRAMAEATKRLIRDPALCERIGRAARERVKTRFDSGVCIRNLEDVLLALCGDVPPREEPQGKGESAPADSADRSLPVP